MPVPNSFDEDTIARMVLSSSVVRTSPGTWIENVLSNSTTDSKERITPLISNSRTTGSPGEASPPTIPVTLTNPVSSMALILSSAVMFSSSVIVGFGGVARSTSMETNAVSISPSTSEIE